MISQNTLLVFIASDRDEARHDWSRKIGLKVSDLVGGCTVIQNCTGYYKYNGGEIGSELSDLVLVVTDTPDEVLRQIVPILWEYVVLEMQESILVVSGGIAHNYDQNDLIYGVRDGFEIH